MCQHKLSHVWVQGEAEHAVTDGQHKGVAAGVEAVAGGQQVLAWLAHVGDAGLQGLVQVALNDAALTGLVDAKDAANADACERLTEAHIGDGT